MNTNYKSKVNKTLWQIISAVCLSVFLFVAAANAQMPLRANGKIAFTSDRDGNSEIYVMNPDGSNQVRLTNNSVVDDNAEWSPDGRRIAFACGRPSGGFALCLMNADGTNRTEIIALHSSTAPGAISWSPDGSRLAYEEYPDIYVVNIDGTNRRKLTGDNPSWDTGPSWSPDGLRILFSRYVSNGIGPILHTIRPDGTVLQALPNGFGDGFGDFSPSWSPAGDKITFLVNVWDFDDSIFTANADGTNRQFFDGCPTLGCGADRGVPHWSPDGTRVVFHISNRFHTRQDLYTRNTDGTGFVQLTDGPGRNINPSWQPLLPTACPNPIDCNEFFVRQHYQDFLNRDPDAAGLAFWTNEITLCGADQSCIEAKRINVSAAYFLSIEFQQTGYLVYRFYKASYGNALGAPVPVRLNEFLPDTKEIGQGVVVNQFGWEQVLESNKQAFATEFVQRSRFVSAYPTSMSSEQFVDALFANAGVTPSATDRAAAINEFAFGATTADVVARSRALRQVAENSTLQQQEFNRAFVLMQYFGYLRRNPNDPPEATLDFQGYNFWLNKLTSFNGNFQDAEMVKAFLVSTEYRQRFAPE